MAEREGFEPSKVLTPYTLSKRARSTTLPPLLKWRQPIQPYPKPDATVTVAPFQAWRSSQHIAFRGPRWVTIGERNANRISAQFLATPGFSLHL